MQGECITVVLVQKHESAWYAAFFRETPWRTTRNGEWCLFHRQPLAFRDRQNHRNEFHQHLCGDQRTTILSSVLQAQTNQKRLHSLGREKHYRIIPATPRNLAANFKCRHRSGKVLPPAPIHAVITHRAQDQLASGSSLRIQFNTIQSCFASRMLRALCFAFFGGIRACIPTQ